jgi:hypothetical protein
VSFALSLETHKEGFQKSFHNTKWKLNIFTQVKKKRVNEMYAAISSILVVINGNVTGTAFSARNTPVLKLKCKLNYSEDK